MKEECVDCFLKQAERICNKFSIKKEIKDKINYQFLQSLNNSNNIIAPEISRILNILIKENIGIDDLYKEEKTFYNKLLLNHENKLRDIIKNSKDPFITALKLSIAGNLIDFGPLHEFDIIEFIKKVNFLNFDIDNSLILKNYLTKSKKLLYLGDNAGEIVLDKLFIETIKSLYPEIFITFAVRGDYILNDVTIEDAEYVNLNNLVNVIDNGYDAPSTILEKCSDEFKNTFNTSDIVISKGQGNFEGLLNNKEKDIFFLLMIKCNVISNYIGKQKNSIIVLHNKNI